MDQVRISSDNGICPIEYILIKLRIHDYSSTRNHGWSEQLLSSSRYSLHSLCNKFTWYLISASRAARNLAYHRLTDVLGQYTELDEFLASELLRLLLHTPFHTL